MIPRKKNALIALFVLLGLVLGFHLLILTGVIPYDIVWAGKLKSHEEMIQFETVSIAVNACMLMVFVLKYRSLRRGKTNKVIDVAIWIFAGLFALNTIGNLFAQSTLELIFGTLLTLTSTILCVLVVRK